MHNIRKKEKINYNIRDSFLHLEFMHNYIEDNLHEKSIVVYQFKYLIKEFNDVFIKVQKEFDYINKIINLY